MLFTALAVALLCLVPVSISAPVACEELVRPLAQLDLGHLAGRWALVAGGLSHLPNLERFRRRDSAAVNFSPNTSDSTITYTRSIRLDNKCMFQTYNISLEGSGFTYDGTPQSNVSANFVRTSCRDCLLMRMDLKAGTHVHLYLFSRRRRVDAEEMEEFRAQAECLNMPPPVVMDPTKATCPDETAAAQTDEETVARKN